MYGSQSDSGNWDHMLDGTRDSIMQMQTDQEPTELKKLDNDNQQQLQTSSLLAGKVVGHFRHRRDLITPFPFMCDGNMNETCVFY